MLIIFAFKMNENYYDQMIETLSNYTDIQHLTHWFKEEFSQRCNSYRILQEETGFYEVDHSALFGFKHHLQKFSLAENYLSYMVSKWSTNYIKSSIPSLTNSFIGLCAKHIGLIDTTSS